MSKQEIVDYVMNTPHNINPAILNQKLDEMEVQPDWNQNDPKASDYVKNRTHYEETVETDIAGTTYTLGDVSTAGTIYTHNGLPLKVGQVWTLSYKVGRLEPSFSDLPVLEAQDGTLYIGDPNLKSVPFYVTATTYKAGTIVNTHGRGTVSAICVSGTVIKTIVHKLDEKYLPNRVFVIDTTASDFGNKVSDPTYGDSVKEALLNGKTIFVYDGIAYGTVGSFVVFDASASGQGIGLNLYIITDKCLLLGSLEYVDIISLQISSI